MKKRTIFALAAALLFFVIFGCSNEKAIEEAISAFEDAVNNDSTAEMQDALSEASDFYITQTFSELLDHFDGFRPVSYTNLDMSMGKENADVNATASLAGISEQALFVMRKESGFMSFIAPQWKVRQYWDTNNTAGELEYVWKKIQRMLKQAE